MADLPVEVQYGRVRGQIIRAVIDSSDPGVEPDSIAGSGEITFTPEVNGPVSFPGLSGVLVSPDPIVVSLGDDGSFDEMIVATDVGNPTGWTYKVSFNVIGMRITPFSISVLANSDNLIDEWLPSSSSTGTLTLRGPQGIQGIQGFVGGSGTPGTPGSGTVNLPEIATNLVKNPSFETDIGGWSAEAGSTLARSTADKYFGSASAQHTTNIDASGGASSSVVIPGLVVGKTYRFSVWVKQATAPPAGVSGPGISLVSGGGVGVVWTTAPSDWVQLEATFVSSDTSLIVYFRSANSGGNGSATASGYSFYIDSVMLTEGPDLLEYFDGDQPGCYWTGAARNSASVKSIYDGNDVVRIEKTPELARNLLDEPVFSQWYGSGGAGYHGKSSLFGDARSLIKTWTTAPTGSSENSGVGSSGALATPGAEYTFSAEVRSSRVQGIRLRITWLDSSGASISQILSAGVLTVAGVTSRLTLTGAAPENAATAAVLIYVGLPGALTPWQVGDTLDSGRMTLVEGRADTPWFDGDSIGARWLGLPASSPSVKMLFTKADDNLLTWLDAGRAQGQGFPEGIVTAPVGTRYVDTLATSGAIEWIKATGAGNTGWRVSTGDTGERNIASLLINGYTGSFQVSRVGSIVFLSAIDIDATTGSGNVIATLPIGLRSRHAVNYTGHRVGSSAILRFAVETGGSVLMVSSTTVNNRSHVSYVTNDPWPTTLPGTPA